MKLFSLFVVFFLSFIFCGCSNEAPEKDEVKTNKPENGIDSAHAVNTKSVTADSLNFTDKNGLKQGVWKYYRGNKLYKIENHIDGKLNGIVREWKTGEYHESHYKNNLLDSLKFMHFTFNKDTMLCYAIWSYNNGTQKWFGFPLVLLTTGFPIKPFHLYEDTSTIWIPYKNGHPFYTGTFVRDKQSGEGIGIGEHKMYYKNGKIKAYYNYDSNLMKVYTNRGALFKESGITPNNFSEKEELQD